MDAANSAGSVGVLGRGPTPSPATIWRRSPFASINLPEADSRRIDPSPEDFAKTGAGRAVGGDGVHQRVPLLLRKNGVRVQTEIEIYDSQDQPPGVVRLNELMGVSEGCRSMAPSRKGGARDA